MNTQMTKLCMEHTGILYISSATMTTPVQSMRGPCTPECKTRDPRTTAHWIRKYLQCPRSFALEGTSVRSRITIPTDEPHIKVKKNADTTGIPSR